MCNWNVYFHPLCQFVTRCATVKTTYLQKIIRNEFIVPDFQDLLDVFMVRFYLAGIKLNSLEFGAFL